jgi:hypothetical protein
LDKKVLIVDSSKNTREFLQLLINDFSDFSAEVEFDYDSIVENYSNDKYEFMIFDHNCKISDKLMEYILTNNPSQKCILLSDSINCPIDCNTCLKTFNFVRLLKPIDAKDVLKYIDPNIEFTCPNKNVFDSIDTLEKLYKFLNLESNIYFTQKELFEDKIVISSIMSNSLRIEEIDQIEENISKKYFEVNVSTNNKIEITKV